MAVFEFQKQLLVGNRGEEEFSKQFPGFNRTDGRTHDLINDETGETVEIKTETRTLTETPNIFVERWSSIQSQKPGGPWQSKAEYFVFYFEKDNRFFIYNRAELIERVEALVSKLKLISVPNRTYTTQGYAVPREWLKDLEHEAVPPDERIEQIIA